jgi:dinuclear metal center YbgI/SA1388 family protein
VHHGLFWGKPVAFTGFQYRRIRELVAGDCALYAVHLPLDAHPTLGNNAGIARRLGLRAVRPFGEHRGVKIGCRGELPEALSLERVAALCCGAHAPLSLLPFGPQAIRSVGIVSGGASQDALQAIAEGLDLFISGEPSHTVYHACLEAGINALFGGHYLTEVWGVKSVGEWLAREHGLETCFLDIPTGL